MIENNYKLIKDEEIETAINEKILLGVIPLR